MTRGRIQDGAAPSRFPRLRARAGAIIALLVVILIVAGYLYASHAANGYYTISPGTAPAIVTTASCAARPVSFSLPDGRPCVRLVAPASRTHPVSGGILMVDVSLGPTTTGEYILQKVGLLGHVNSGAQLLPKAEVLGNTPPSQYNQVNDLLMTDSSQAATVVALRRLGYKVPQHDTGASVGEVVAGSPAAAGHLSSGDTIVAVDGKSIATAQQLVAAIHAHRPGQVVSISAVASTGKRRTVQVRLTKAPAGSTAPGEAFLGVGYLQTRQQFQYPFAVQIDAGNIGGPSAGLAFTLAMLDYLGGGKLTGGRLVAATGTISLNGSVGQVGGVSQKAIAVRRAGAKLFLVPQAELADARSQAGSSMKVVGVSNLSQALAALVRFGGSTAGLSAAAS